MKLKQLWLLFIGAITMNVNAQTMPLDEAKIRSNINSFSALADQGAFEYLGRLFAPELTVDYTTLFGGEAQLVKRQDLIKQWAGFLPGFDATFHHLSNLNVSIDGDKANATVDFTASHWLGAVGFWAVSGEYEFELQRASDNWQITSVKLNRKAEQGSRDILAEAPNQAAQNLKSREALKVIYQ
ncbi:nuclear transport factor 2 family protein [Vibrio sp. SCSIO 43133]|uniref:nuclear transport factor 2 family protein n=1 Tax=Vibrio sp. SCSIO 43133 TaxID=2802577 RepID=UPI00207536B1|nr:nuclear transport factor 2 family protein [Vibrio sp. SCSIO 43133]USE01853.1 nuclear transport factor 2 family protein [Vibrio sp. SCSIO 43133]